MTFRQFCAILYLLRVLCRAQDTAPRSKCEGYKKFTDDSGKSLNPIRLKATGLYMIAKIELVSRIIFKVHLLEAQEQIIPLEML